MAKQNRVVVETTEDGWVSVYGPYTKKEAQSVSNNIYDHDTSQKSRVDVQKLVKYEMLPDDEED